MKQSSMIVSILLVVLMASGWISVFLGTDSEEYEEYTSHIAAAGEYVSRELYQKAIEEYATAISIKGTEEDWTNMLSAYANRYQESSKIYGEYVEVVQEALIAYEENADYIMTLVNLYMDKEEYELAYKCIERATGLGIENNNISNLFSKIKYAYHLKWKSYIDYRPLCNGYYAVSETGVWTYITEDGSDTKFSKLKLAGSVGEQGIRMIYDGKKGQLIDGKEVVWGKLNFVPIETGVFAEGFIPIKDENSYAYYNDIGDKQFGDYIEASTFINGKAAIKKENKWKIINNKGEAVSENTYADIKLSNTHKYLENGYMIAKRNDKYQLFNINEEVISDFECEDIDILTQDGVIAFCNNGKWGFVDLTGNVVIEPKYSSAKSFSNGLAAVSDGEKWGFIDKKGKLVIEYTFLDADYFNSKGCCMVESANNVWQLLALYITR